MRLFAILFLIAALAGCTYPYREPEVSSGGEIRGAADYLRQSGRVRMILTHGMCSDVHRAEDGAEGTDRVNWVALRAGQIAGAVGAPFTPEPAYTPVATYGDGPAKVERYEMTLDAPEGAIDITFLIWGRLADAARAALEFENTAQDSDAGAPVRAPVNAALKRDLMNRCLIDAVVYLGTSGDAIRRGMREAVCDTMGGRYRPAKPAGSPTSPAECSNTRASGVPTVLVPESLGSSVLFDAYQGLRDAGSTRPVAAALRDVRAIFLASNQVAFLSQGNAAPRAALRSLGAPAAAADSLDGFLRLLGSAPRLRTAAPPAPVQLVAITDPNDVLGYRLDLARYNPSEIEARNVLVSNAGAILGLFADPITAHTNTARTEVFAFIAEGTTPR